MNPRPHRFPEGFYVRSDGLFTTGEPPSQGFRGASTLGLGDTVGCRWMPWVTQPDERRRFQLLRLWLVSGSA